jgi:hypothetical protein
VAGAVVVEVVDIGAREQQEERDVHVVLEGCDYYYQSTIRCGFVEEQLSESRQKNESFSHTCEAYTNTTTNGQIVRGR